MDLEFEQGGAKEEEEQADASRIADSVDETKAVGRRRKSMAYVDGRCPHALLKL